MKIAKLIIKPILNHGTNTIFNHPSTNQAQRLINEKLASSSGIYEHNAIPKKLPKWMKAFVNPKSWVGPAK